MVNKKTSTSSWGSNNGRGQNTFIINRSHKKRQCLYQMLGRRPFLWRTFRWSFFQWFRRRALHWWPFIMQQSEQEIALG